MDRRTVLFAISAFLALFLVNTYFNWQHEEKLKQWNIDQKAKKENTLLILEEKVIQRTAEVDELPIVTIYADEALKTSLTEAVRTGNALFTTNWMDPLPQTVYAHKDGSNNPQAYQLSHSENGEVALYQTDDKKDLQIGNLPDLGAQDLQIVAFPAGKASVELGEYRDGLLTVLNDKIEELKSAINSDYKKRLHLPKTGIVLMQSGQSYLPVGLYIEKEKKFVPFEDIVPIESKTKNPHHSAQEYYVLENSYQQLVISTIGGALAEINLPFESKTNTLSVVKPIDQDRILKEKHPQEAHFPSHAYFTPGSDPQGPFVVNKEGALGGYYPLIRRDLIEGDPWKSIQINPRYYALNLLSESPEISELVYTVKHFDSKKLVLEAQQRRRKITKTYLLPDDENAPYIFDLFVKIEGEKKGLWLSSGIPEVELFSGNSEPILKYRITKNNNSNVEMISLPENSITNTSTHADWLANSNGFFSIIMDPLAEVSEGYRATMVPGQSVPTRLVEIDQSHNRYSAENFPGYLLMAPIKTSQPSMHYRIFAGPLSEKVLKAVDQTYSDPAIGYNPDYIATQSYHGFFAFISEPFAKFLFVLMKFFHFLTGSWAFSIILLTVALRIMMYPLNAWSTKSMLRTQEVMPLVSAIQEKYKNDPKRAQLEIIELYREKKINPLSGCFPLLIQLPFLIGMFDLLKSTFELRGASFIPGWIDNLTAPDVLFSWGTPIFFIGNQFHLLPIILGAVMFFQQRMSTSSSKKVEEMTDAQRQQRAAMTFMPIIFALMFYHFPSGLNIYWLSSMLLGMLQQWWTQKRMTKTGTPEKPIVLMPNKKNK